MRIIFIAASIIFLIISCDNTYKHSINYESLQKDLAYFNNKRNDLSNIQNEFLKYLGTYNQNPEIKTFVNSLSDSDFTYLEVFSKLSEIHNEVFSLTKKKEKLFEDINDTCNFIQHEITMQKHLRDSLNSLIKPEINIARKTIWDYYLSVIEIDSRILNYSNSKVKYVAFDYIIKKNDSVFYKIPCEVDVPILKKVQRDFIFDDELHATFYKNMESVGLPFYSADYQVKKIVFANGNILAIDEKYYNNETYTDKQYKRPSNLNGECPYLIASDILTIQLNHLKAQIDNLIHKTSPALSPFIKWYFNY